MNEAKRIANLQPSQRSKSRNKASPTKSQIDSSLGESRNNNNQDGDRVEKKLLESVESLILGIKSGQLVREQESSNKRIQEILATVLDKESMRAFGFRDEDDETTKSVSFGGETGSHHDASVAEMLAGEETFSELKEASENADAKSNDIGKQSIDSSRTNEKLPSGIPTGDSQGKLSKERTPRIDDYEDEIDMYLASLPARVTTEDLLSANASRVRLHERASSSGGVKKSSLVNMEHYMRTRLASDREQRGKVSLEERFARNLHLFCMLEHERRQVLLLPDELIDVTRKFHTRDRYRHVRDLETVFFNLAVFYLKKTKFQAVVEKRASVGSPESTINSQKASRTSIQRENLNTRQGERAERLVQALNDFEESTLHILREQSMPVIQKTSTKEELLENDEKMSTTTANDSGVGDEIDSWRLRAENAVRAYFLVLLFKIYLILKRCVSRFNLICLI